VRLPVPRRRTRRGLFRRYAIIVVGVVGASLVAGGLVQALFSYRDNRDAILRVQQDTVVSAAANISHFITQTETQLRTTVQQADPRSQSGYVADRLSLEERRNDYRQLLLRVPSLTEISYLDPLGRLQFRVSRLTPRAVVAGTDYSHDARFTVPKSGRSYYGTTHFRDPCGRLAASVYDAPVVQCVNELEQPEPDVTVAVPYEPGVSFVGDAEKVSGVTVAEVNLSVVQDLIAEIKLGTGGYAYVVDAQGRLVAGPSAHGILPSTDLSSLEHVRAALPGGGGSASGGAVTGRNILGIEVFSSYHPIAPPGWTVFVEQPRDEAFAPLNGFIVRTAVLLVIGLVLAVFASLLLARRMATPILALQRAASRIGAGHLAERIDVRGGDELAALGATFNRMSAELQESYRDLEGKVAERTHELAEASRQLAAASRHKSEFLANMSHELRTPLNAVIGFSEVLLERLFGDLNEKQQEYLNDILTSGQHLLALINDILDLSKVEAGRLELQIAPMRLPELLESSAAMMRERAVRNGITLRLDIDPEVDVIRADERRIKQVLFNLISNALKFTPQGGHVTISASADTDWVHIAVRDDGGGIAEEDQARIFEEFEQAGTHNAQEGTGLGLPLSRRFVEMHRGRLWLESRGGEGSTFTFSLPQKPEVAAEDREPSAAVESGRAPAAGRAEP
jgi:signal transduction histidine kinase